MQDTKQKLSGAMALFMLFGDGIKKFTGTKSAAIKSCWIALLIYPLQPLFSWLYSPRGMEQLPYADIFWTVTIFYVVSFVLGIVIAYAYAAVLKQQEKFWLYLEASNWVSVASLVLFVPFMIAASSGVFDRLYMDRALVVLGCYGYIVTGCIAYRAISANWQLAAAFACANLALGGEIWNMLLTFQGIPDPWA